MGGLLIQVGPQGVIGIDLPWLIAICSAIIGSLATALGVTYRGQIKALTDENRRKDELIDKLIRQTYRAADVADKSVSLAERERTRRS